MQHTKEKSQSLQQYLPKSAVTRLDTCEGDDPDHWTGIWSNMLCLLIKCATRTVYQLLRFTQGIWILDRFLKAGASVED